MRWFRQKIIGGGVIIMSASLVAAGAADRRGAEFRTDIRPLLENYCFDCHADGANKGNVTFDEFKSDQAALEDRELWLHVLKNLRANLMPPRKKSQPTPEEKQRLEQWIKRAVFNADPQNPDPGRVTIRRLNRVEYRNTIRDLLGVDFDTATVFPPDDTGHGFDNIGAVLTLPPMLLEKYVLAADQIITVTVPTVAQVVREQTINGGQFRRADAATEPPKKQQRGGLSLSFYQPATATYPFKAERTGQYELHVALTINERYVDNVFDYNKCRLSFRVDGQEQFQKEFSWAGGKSFQTTCAVDWPAGKHDLTFELQPLTPDEPQTRSLSLQIASVNVRGPLAREHWVQPKNYTKFFPKKVPADATGQRAYARELLGNFARRAFRRPVDDATLDRLVRLAEATAQQPGKTFEAGVAQGMVAILASPRFLFREEQRQPDVPGNPYPLIDEYSLASRLSYFLWSSMPDEELLQLAAAGRLRKNLTAQVNRMLQDKKSDAFVQNFVGQWLRARDIEVIPIEARSVLAREENSAPEVTQQHQRFNELNQKAEAQRTPEEQAELARLRESFRRQARQPLRAELTPEIRRAMRLETERSFDYVLRQDRSLLELLDADYTFLNEKLAAYYGIANVSGGDLRRVKLPPDSPRGGILTQGTMLGVTSNPTRTSPVKRGIYVLDNILGTPPPPPPPDLPPLEAAAKGITNHPPSLRETLALHRENVLCASCHDRMDPLGLAFENFNAMGLWRDAELSEPIDATGVLITGEPFRDVRELKQILVKNHYKDFYRTVTEKLLIYALGRGLEYYDVETCDQIEARLEAAKGRPSALIAGIVASAPFQKMRAETSNEPKSAAPPTQRADARTHHEHKTTPAH